MLTTLFTEIIILTGSLSPYCFGNIGGMFDDNLNAITVCPNLTEAQTDFVIGHELGHYFWSEKLTNRERDLYISKYKRDSGKKERFFREYSMENFQEDFADNFALIYDTHGFSQNKERHFTQRKVLIRSFIRKYDKK